MKRELPAIFVVLVVLAVFIFAACSDSTYEERRSVERQQEQYMIGQPIPMMDWSLERQLIIDLYLIRNTKVATHAVWRSDYGIIEGDCPSMGFGLPYDTSLTNPLQKVYGSSSGAVVEQAEPNGIFASKTTSATWVMCLSDTGGVEPVYVESKVTVYPGPVIVDYEKNRVTRSGAATVLIPESSLGE